MRIRAAVAAGVGVLVLVAAGLAPNLLAGAEPAATPSGPGDRGIGVPFELSGLYLTDCREQTSFPDEAAVARCLQRYEIEPLTPSVYFDGFHRAMYAGYFAGQLVPCLRDHGFEVDTLSNDIAPPADLSGWYLRMLLDGSSFDEVIATWHDCPLVPPYLEEAVRTRDGMVE